MKRLREMLAAQQPVSREVRKKFADTPVAGVPFHRFMITEISRREKEGRVSHPVKLAWLKDRLKEYPDLPRLERQKILNQLIRWLQETEEKTAAAPPAKAPAPGEEEAFLQLSDPARFAWLLGAVMYLKGVGPKVAALLHTLGVDTPLDLLWNPPLAYENLSQVTPLNQLAPEVKQLMQGVLTQAQQRRGRRGQLITHGLLIAPEGQVTLVWFNQPYLVNHLPWGTTVTVAGKPKPGRYGMEVANPEMEPTREAGPGVMPDYRLTEGLTMRQLRKMQHLALERLREQPVETLPPEIRRRRELMALLPAFEALHFPPSMEDTAAPRKRLIYEELLLSQVYFVGRRKQQNQPTRPPPPPPAQAVASVAAQLGFDLSEHQQQALGEILPDMERATPMRRLLQGDVGSGKTAVCALAMAAVAGLGEQAALVAPTEILAEQHFITLKRLFAGTGFHVGLLTGSLSATQKQALKMALHHGQIQLVVGTHALFERNVGFEKLGLIVVDEHHRFGVEQRHHLTQKAPLADLLVMTATPIPRTLALTKYGDLTLSVIARPPKTRAGVNTLVLPLEQKTEVAELIRKTVARKEQVYFVCPLIEESEALQASAATARYEELKIELPDLRLGLLHGRMKVAEKEAAMEGLRRGELDVLVATTVIEVGVDVPGATLMVIEHAERFGLSQLHQLRGRVGRGSGKGLCVLFGDLKGQKARERLYVMANTDDGFEVARLDLAIRGPGRVLGTEQSGFFSDFAIADLNRSADQKLLEWAREDAEALLAEDPDLTALAHRAMKLMLDRNLEKYQWAQRA